MLICALVCMVSATSWRAYDNLGRTTRSMWIDESNYRWSAGSANHSDRTLQGTWFHITPGVPALGVCASSDALPLVNVCYGPTLTFFWGWNEPSARWKGVDPSWTFFLWQQ